MSTTIYDNMSTVDDTTYTVIIMHNIPSIVSIWSYSKHFNHAQIGVSAIISTLYVLIKCYKIWGANKKIIVLPVFISIINNAGRIWWIGYQVSKFLPTKQFNLTRHIMAVCLESGIMYPLALTPALVLIFRPHNDLSSNIDIVPVLIQVVGIAPTFIINFLWDSVYTLVINVMPVFCQKFKIGSSNLLKSMTIYANLSTIMVFQVHKNQFPGFIDFFQSHS
ncbi:hypothetical protein K435DRAFT_800396 [Dendrothele bispora CBS 962.96]|uniref:Uncharacterized protein n=1 Tax=Dendrothele bispora (strain CBS 962.96) TaxID=1314807 RepID=A0A4S8LSR0_DENBC|nr:hypothetical protein K435DRAFT_800396 [Dendrothele bispora CBS 962.96]